MLRRIRSLLEMIRFSHTIFALPFGLLSASLAWHEKGGFQWLDLAGILLCMVFARSAAMAFNRLVDRQIDAANPRTKMRHLPAGVLSPTTVWAFALVCGAGFLGSTLIFYFESNPWPLILSVPVLVFLAVYSYTKRFTVFSHFWLGTSLMLAPIAAWIAIVGLRDLLVPMVLGLVVLFWVAGFDILYACQDFEFDRRAGLFSIPARWGIFLALKIALACHLAMVGMMILLWLVAPQLGWIYLAGVGAVTLLLIYEHWLVTPNDLSQVNRAFFLVNGIISVGLLLVVWLQLAMGN
jgi:4-hydroxybenzoate polyprenyltransferase